MVLVVRIGNHQTSAVISKYIRDLFFPRLKEESRSHDSPARSPPGSDSGSRLSVSWHIHGLLQQRRTVPGDGMVSPQFLELEVEQLQGSGKYSLFPRKDRRQHWKFLLVGFMFVRKWSKMKCSLGNHPDLC